jgi:hypothetical protein
MWAFAFIRAAILCGTFMLLSAALAHPSMADGRIEWRLENPFRLFNRPEHTDLHRQIYESLNLAERREPILASERKLAARSGGRGWAEAVFNETCYDQNDDSYDACRDYVLPKSHRIIAKLRRQSRIWDVFRDNETTPADESCDWQMEDRAGKALARVSAPCGRAVKFDIPYPQGARLRVSGVSEPLDIKVQDVLILGLGDSFGAGEGNPDHPVRFNDDRSQDYGVIDIAASGARERLSGYPARAGNWTALSGPAFRRERARWWDRECHRSLYSHQLRAALQLAVENPKRAITFLSFSGSGAEIVEGILLRTPVRECSPGEHFAVPSQLSAASRALCRRAAPDSQMPAAIIDRVPELRKFNETAMRVSRCQADTAARGPALKRPVDLVMLSAGGNDVGFVPLVADSMLSDSSIYRLLGKQLGFVYGPEQARKRLALVRQRFDGLKYALELFLGVRGGGGGKVILTGYPNMGYDGGGMSACAGTGGLEVFPPFRLDAGKVAKSEDFASELNTALKRFAARDWVYVDGFRGDFRAHGLCAVNGGGLAETIGFPRLKNNVWTPYKPSLFPAYTARQRWFRTPNDAFLSVHMHAETVANFGANCSGLYTGALRTIAQSHWLPFQLFLASTYGGAFHPTAEGQARIADEVADAARDLLPRTN